eukprot:TRINITY_DN48291_c0_g1_i1.p1 TRINITY_DN48291_c0_g1~~TRINITY_DN48291_c0_g1_i1.p1  ORF type:complete len:617 (-),score=92.83 TRINITY_DN48291_c0_g1_i1:136-1986(-)
MAPNREVTDSSAVAGRSRVFCCRRRKASTGEKPWFFDGKECPELGDCSNDSPSIKNQRCDVAFSLSSSPSLDTSLPHMAPPAPQEVPPPPQVAPLTQSLPAPLSGSASEELLDDFTALLAEDPELAMRLSNATRRFQAFHAMPESSGEPGVMANKEASEPGCSLEAEDADPEKGADTEGPKAAAAESPLATEAHTAAAGEASDVSAPEEASTNVKPSISVSNSAEADSCNSLVKTPSIAEAKPTQRPSTQKDRIIEKDSAVEDAHWSTEERAVYVSSLRPSGEPPSPALQRFLLDFLQSTQTPEPWVIVRSPTGKVFFANKISRHTSWRHPLEFAMEELGRICIQVMQMLQDERAKMLEETKENWVKEANAQLAKWVVVTAREGRAECYYNSETGEASWLHPHKLIIPLYESRLAGLSKLADAEYMSHLQLLHQPISAAPVSQPAGDFYPQNPSQSRIEAALEMLAGASECSRTPVPTPRETALTLQEPPREERAERQIAEVEAEAQILRAKVEELQNRLEREQMKQLVSVPDALKASQAECAARAQGARAPLAERMVAALHQLEGSSDGKVSNQALSELLRALNCTEDEVSRITTALDTHGDGTIDINHFVDWFM